MYGDSEGSIGRSRGYYFNDITDLMSNRFSSDDLIGDIDTLYDNTFGGTAYTSTCNNEYYTFTDTIFHNSGGSEGFDVLLSDTGFKGDYTTDKDSKTTASFVFFIFFLFS